MACGMPSTRVRSAKLCAGFMQISSRSNPTIKSIRALRERKERERTQLFFVEGIRLVAEAVQLHTSDFHVEIETLVYAPELLKSDFALGIVQQAQNQSATCVEVSADVFASLSQKDGPQGLAAVIKQRWTPLATLSPQSLALSPQPSALYLALESPQDPGNIGTILRTADAVGVDGIILLGQHADPYDPDAVRASMGAIFTQQLIRATFAELLAWKNTYQLSLLGTSDKAGQDYRAANYRQPLIVLMGSERQGITAEQSQACDQLVAIPMRGRSDSLNLAVATGILLYEIHNQRFSLCFSI